ncbi:hypothetical protein P879_09239 [Paragonimus westermani]|uniref:FAR1 domain-containing protein n=1 Tax=Paragonimus westermani TaxID=34504 RepID=A0A8T0DH25_9TREM|nr:hypothetical protein P879_09239 [Paragonimus westermani]
MSCAVDLSEQFEGFFGSAGAPKLFDTLEQLEETLNQFQQLFGAVYRIRSTEYDVGTPRRRVYICTRRGQPLKPSRGIRKKPSGQTGCGSIINANRSDDGYFRVTKFTMIHNHHVDPLSAKHEPSRRRLSKSEANAILPLLLSGISSNQLRQYVTMHFDKDLTSRDICNMRSKYTVNDNPVL